MLQVKRWKHGKNVKRKIGSAALSLVKFIELNILFCSQGIFFDSAKSNGPFFMWFMNFNGS